MFTGMTPDVIITKGVDKAGGVLPIHSVSVTAGSLAEDTAHQCDHRQK